jgi:hypothetical protein
VFAGGVTMFQIAIAIAAISALTRRRPFWIVSLLFGAAGCAFLVLAAIQVKAIDPFDFAQGKLSIARAAVPSSYPSSIRKRPKGCARRAKERRVDGVRVRRA